MIMTQSNDSLAGKIQVSQVRITGMFAHRIGRVFTIDTSIGLCITIPAEKKELLKYLIDVWYSDLDIKTAIFTITYSETPDYAYLVDIAIDNLAEVKSL